MNELLTVLCAWSVVLLVDLSVVYFFVSLANRSNKNEKHNNDSKKSYN